MTFTYEIESTNPLYHMVQKYITHYKKGTNYRVFDFKKDKFIFGLPFCKEEFKFDSYTILFEHVKEGSPVSVGISADYYCKIILISEIRDNLDKFILDARQHCIKVPEHKIVVKIFKNNFWQKVSELSKRELDTIFLDGNKKKQIINDLEYFFNNEDDYNKYSVPYKRNYLLYGPPGTGKSSLIYSIASKYNLNINILAFNPSITDGALITAVNKTTKNSILLLEDIDALFKMRARNNGNNSLVSFSCLLNVLDGLSCKHGLIIFMTTNFLKHLDQALIRPGRIDLKLELDYITKSQFLKMITKLSPNQLEYCKEFYKQIRNKKITPAIIQKYLFHCYQKNKTILDEISYFNNLLDENTNNYNNMYA